MADQLPMDLLVCAATPMELQAFGGPFNDAALPEGNARRDQIGFLLTGVGIPAALARILESGSRQRPARILNIGIAGAYPGSGLGIGDIVMGQSEVYGDVGFELPEEPSFRHAGEAPWGAFYRDPLPLARFVDFAGVPLGRGCTVNNCTGTEETGRLRARLFEAAFETMEGAAVAQAGQTLGIPVCEIRAISNSAGRRDMRPENIQLALSRLRDYFHSCRETPHA